MEEAQTQVNAIFSILSTLSLSRLLGALAMLIIGILLIRWIMKFLNQVLQRIPSLDATVEHLIRSALRWFFYLILAVIIAGYLGIPISSFVALISVVGIAISLAIQGVLTNLAGGIIILTSKPFAPGDFVQLGDLTGTVQYIGILYTKLLAPDGRIMYIPNGTLYNSNQINFTENGRRRIDLSVSASYDSDPKAVREAVLDAIAVIAKDPDCGLLNEPTPRVYLDSYQDSNIQYLVHVWCDNASFFVSKMKLNEEIYDAFKRHHVEMSYPQLNVHTMK